MRILVTGCCGYLGSVLVYRLLQKGYQVRGIDSGLYGYESLQQFENNSEFELIKRDVRDLVSLSESLKDVDAVVHLAGIVGMQASNIDLGMTFEINYLATKNIAELCDMKQIPFIFASTCSVYGSQPGKQIIESSRVSPQEPYALHKFRCEREILQLHWCPTILRFGTLFGYSKRMRFDLVVNKFIGQALSGRPITVEGGRQNRPFLHVKDASDSIIFAVEQKLDGIFNVVSENYSILDVASIIASNLKGKIQQSAGMVDNRDYLVSVGKIHAFGFTAKYGIGFACNELSKIWESEKFNIDDPKYSNFDSLVLKKPR